MSDENAFHFRRRVEFCETDAAGIAHYSSLIIYMEQAEHALLRSVGISVYPQQLAASSTSQPAVSWPRVHVAADFLGPAFFEDELTVAVLILKMGTTSITYGFELSGPNGPVARGSTISVCCQHGTTSNGRRLLQKEPIPGSIRECLSPFVKVVSKPI